MKQGTYHTDERFVYSSGALNGNFGVQLGASRKHPFATVGEKKFFFNDKHFVALHRDPRGLVVAVTAPFLSFTIAVLHAPCKSNNVMQVVDDWWDVTDELMLQWPESVKLIDGNARVGSVLSTAVGNAGAEIECHSGTRLRLFAELMHSYLPATFKNQEKHTTWKHTPSGREYRIDYVLLPLWWQDKVTDVGLLDIDLLNKLEDHFAQPFVKIRIHDNLKPHARYWGNQVVKPEDISVHAAKRIDDIDNIAKRCGGTETVDRHHGSIHHGIRETLRTACRKKPSLPRKPLMTEGTKLVQPRRKCTHLISWASKATKAYSLDALSAAWQYAAGLHKPFSDIEKAAGPTQDLLALPGVEC